MSSDQVIMLYIGVVIGCCIPMLIWLFKVKMTSKHMRNTQLQIFTAVLEMKEDVEHLIDAVEQLSKRQ